MPRILGVQLSRDEWVHPLYELPFTAGSRTSFGAAPDAFEEGEIGKAAIDRARLWTERSEERSPGPSETIQSVARSRQVRWEVDAQREFRQRGVPAPLANEIFLDVLPAAAPRSSPG